MPNWIEGTFRARGSKENIKKFIMEGLQPVSFFGCDDKIQRKIEFEEDDYIEINFKLDNQNEDQKMKHPKELYIPHTKRNFVELNNWGDITVNSCKKNNDFIFATDFKGAWAIDTEAIVQVAKEFQIDIRVNGYECGMEFEQLLEVDRNGTIKCDSCIEYIDYTWECSMPLLGG